MKLGLIINPIAGMGGKVGLKGTDGHDILEKAKNLGAKPLSGERAKEAFLRLASLKDTIEIITSPGEMGGVITEQLGFQTKTIGKIKEGKTSSTDTISAAKEFIKHDIDFLLFAGGDGTARDIYSAVQDKVVVLGIPTGVKMHSAVYACNPQRAGDLATLFLKGEIKDTNNAEVMDIDEVDLRAGLVSAKLYGYLKIPHHRRYTQGLKARSEESERASQVSIANDVVENMQDGCFYVIGPGTTTSVMMEKLKLKNTLIGVDIIKNRKTINLNKGAFPMGSIP